MILTEQQIINAIKKVINEARRNPETNIDESFADFYNRMIEKAPMEDIFVSFRDTTHVTDVNPVNKYNTPTGFYSYPLSSFDIDENPSEVEFRRSFPFANHREYISFFILKTHDGILTGKTDKSTLDMYVDRIKKLYPTMDKIGNLCDLFINNKYTSDYINKDPDRKVHHGTHLFWLFLYDIANAIQAGNTQNRINLICRKIGVNGFVDYEGKEFIHSAEPKQSVFFKVKNLGEVFTYEKPKISSYAVKNAIQNKEYGIYRVLPDGLIVISLFNKYNLINEDDELLSKAWFDEFGRFLNGFATVEMNNKINFINKDGEILSNQWFDNAGDFEDDVAKVSTFDKGYNYINQEGELISNQWFDWIGVFKDEFAGVQSNGKYNFINKKGELLSNQWFDRVGDFEEGVIRVLVKGKGVNFINQKCELISEQWFDGIVEFNEGVATVKLDSKYNFINKNGKILSKQWFDDGFYWKDGIARVQLNNKFYDLNLNNNSITEVE